MHRRSSCSLLLALALLFAAAPSAAAPRDNAANAKIDEAVNKYYLATEFDKAENLLKGVLDACEDRCSPSVKAKAWMYVGIVRGSGRQDVGGAQEAFQQAVALDPQVKLDDALATPAVRQAFDAAAGGGAAAPEPAPPAPAAAGGMECTPTVREVETQRPIPVSCGTDEPAATVTLRYMAIGAKTWADVKLKKKGEYWQGEIPCSETSTTGTIKFYVVAKDSEGKELDTFGSKAQSTELSIVAATQEEPPSYPGQPAPEKCAEAGACPDDMIGTPACPGTGKGRGTKGWGAPCNTSNECDVGLLCTPGENGRTCESAPSCSQDSDCPSGASCRGGTCDIAAAEEPEPGEEPASASYKKNWLGLHYGIDVAMLSGSNVCVSGDFSCFYAGDLPVQGNGVLSNKYAGNLSGGGSIGTSRLMASYERLLSQQFGLEARVGFAFGGAPKTPNGNAFLPVHAEARAKYWFLKKSFERKGFRPYVHLGGGLAQVDARLKVSVGDCTAAQTAACLSDGVGAAPATLNAWKKLGTGFVTAGAGTMFAIGKNHGILLNLNAMLMLGSTGFVIEPSLGYEVGL